MLVMAYMSYGVVDPALELRQHPDDVPHAQHAAVDPRPLRPERLLERVPDLFFLATFRRMPTANAEGWRVALERSR